METGNLLVYNGEAYFYGSLAEPMSCIVGAYHEVITQKAAAMYIKWALSKVEPVQF